MTQDIQAELRMIREMLSWLRNEERFREEILGVAPAEPGLRPDGLSQSALSQAKPPVPNADCPACAGSGETVIWLTSFPPKEQRTPCSLCQVNIPLRGRIA
jgi:hypothetical protein